jgi:lipopolysaccharide/colanic/teichoic acid biosynthesis glycosyltransferase
MSLVGPRPHAIGMKAAGVLYEDLVPYYELRHAVRPGLSGWAQVNGCRGPVRDAGHAVARIDHDLAYIQNASLLLDLRIILTTLYREFCFGSGS